MITPAKLREFNVERLIQGLEDCPDPLVRNQVRELIAALMEFHGAGLTRMLEIVEKSLAQYSDQFSSQFSRMIRAIGSDPLAGSLLLLYGLHPVDFETRVQEALDHARPELQKYHSDIESVEIQERIVHVRLKGDFSNSPSTLSTIRKVIGRALEEKAPEFEFFQIDNWTDDRKKTPIAGQVRRDHI